MLDVLTGSPKDFIKGVEIISRDRAGAYAEAGRRGASQAVQVSDRFHLYRNMSKTVERVVQRNYSSIKEVLNPITQSIVNLGDTKDELESGLTINWLAAQKQARFQHRLALYEQVLQLSQGGYNHSEIAEELEISRKRVRVYLKAPPKLKTVVKPTKIDSYKVYLKQRFLKMAAKIERDLQNGLKERLQMGFTVKDLISTPA